MTAVLVVALIAPLTLYRASQFAPDERTCIKLTRKIQDGEQVPAKSRFDCWTISEFPTLMWFKRPPQYSYPRNDDGTRSIVVKEVHGEAAGEPQYLALGTHRPGHRISRRLSTAGYSTASPTGYASC